MKNIRCYAVYMVCLLMPVLLGSCKKKTADVPAIDTEEMRNICNLAVMECYYNNVATLSKEDSFFWGKSEKSHWIEYTATIKVGVNASQIEISVDYDTDTVMIGLPQPQNLTDPNIVEDSIKSISSEGLKTKIPPKERFEAIDKANDNMVNDLMKNETLMNNAEKRVKEILKNYVDQIGELSGVEYKIIWKSKEEESKGE